jgi:hypothetical protein
MGDPSLCRTSDFSPAANRSYRLPPLLKIEISAVLESTYSGAERSGIGFKIKKKKYLLEKLASSSKGAFNNTL